MKTTVLYVELLVVGTGTAIVLLLLAHVLFGHEAWFVDMLEFTTEQKFLTSIPILSIIYMLGIVTTNLGHRAFKSTEEKLRNNNLKSGGSPDVIYDYLEVRNQLYTTSNTEALIVDFEFRRSKVRICRGWAVNSVLFSVLFFVLAIPCSMSTLCCENKILWFGFSVSVLILIGTLLAWYTTTKTELDWLKSYYTNLPSPDSAD